MDRQRPPGPERELEFFRLRNQRQRQAILDYIRQQTGLDPKQVPREERNRLALEWVRLFGEGFGRG